eukprot:1156072-Pyramimonas_sp.AAC.1
MGLSVSEEGIATRERSRSLRNRSYQPLLIVIHCPLIDPLYAASKSLQTQTDRPSLPGADFETRRAERGGGAGGASQAGGGVCLQAPGKQAVHARRRKAGASPRQAVMPMPRVTTGAKRLVENHPKSSAILSSSPPAPNMKLRVHSGGHVSPPSRGLPGTPAAHRGDTDHPPARA